MFKKEKILMSLVILMLIVCVCGSISSLATEITAGTNGNGIKITPITGNNTSGNNTSVSATIKNNNTTNNATNNAVTNKVNNATNTSNYSKTNSTKLPYAGTNSSMIFVVLAFAASAIYAYKKVTEYNV